MKPGPLPSNLLVKMADTPEEIEGAKRVEYFTFLDSGYIEPNTQQEVLEYSGFDDVSQFFVVKDGTNVVGMMRIIKYSPKGFKTLKDFTINSGWLTSIEALIKEDPRSVEEIGTLGLLENYRGKNSRAAVAAIFKASWQDSVRRGVKMWIFSADFRLFGLLTNWFEFKVKQIGDGKDYLGSYTVPATLDIQNQREIYQSGSNPDEGSYFLQDL